MWDEKDGMVVEVNLHSQSIDILLEIFVVGGEVL